MKNLQLHIWIEHLRNELKSIRSLNDPVVMRKLALDALTFVPSNDKKIIKGVL